MHVPRTLHLSRVDIFPSRTVSAYAVLATVLFRLSDLTTFTTCRMSTQMGHSLKVYEHVLHSPLSYSVSALLASGNRSTFSKFSDRLDGMLPSPVHVG